MTIKTRSGPRKLRILAVSDRVLEFLYSPDVQRRLPKIDLIISCGDLPYYYLDFLASALGAPLVYVKGNHDVGPQYTADGQTLQGVRGGRNLHGISVSAEEVLIAGLEGSMRYRRDSTQIYSETEMTFQVLRLLPTLIANRIFRGRALDILVTHSPAFDIHDAPDLPHTGFRIFRTLIRLARPRLHLHGHVHVYRNDQRRQTTFHSSESINVYPYKVLEYDLT